MKGQYQTAANPIFEVFYLDAPTASSPTSPAIPPISSEICPRQVIEKERLTMTQSEKRLFLIQSLLKERPEYRQVETPRDPEGQRQLLRGLMNVRPPQAADPDFLRVQDAYL